MVGELRLQVVSCLKLESPSREVREVISSIPPLWLDLRSQNLEMEIENLAVGLNGNRCQASGLKPETPRLLKPHLLC